MKPIKPLLQVHLTLKNFLVFQFFFFLMHELHEIAHIVTGRILCGCWAIRDFNVWTLCDTCKLPYSATATFAGPLFTFAMLWLGRYWLKYGSSASVRSLGMVFIFGNMPFGRLYMAAMGSGDEVYGLRMLFLNAGHSNLLLIRLAGLAIVSLICIPPLLTAYKAIANKQKVLLFATLLVLPLILDTVILLMILNGLLAKGILNQVVIMGTPLLITLWLIGCVAIVAINFRALVRFAQVPG